MEHTYYRIGEVSRVTGISKDTLHFYNKIGLLVPDYIDPDNQYRYVWLTFPVTESIAMCCCCLLYHRCICANIIGRVP